MVCVICQLLADFSALQTSEPGILPVDFCHQDRSGISYARDNVAVCANVDDEVFKIKDVAMRMMDYFCVRLLC